MSQIDTLVSAFINDLRRAIASEASAAFASVAQSDGHAVGNGRRKPGPKPKGLRAAFKAPKAAKKSGKRTSEEVEGQAKTLLAAIKKAPGMGIEGLAKETGISTKELALPVLKLWDQKAISSKGQRRGTKYFAK